MWKRMTAKTEGLYVADTESFVTKQMDKLDFDYGGIPGDLHFGLTKKLGPESQCFQEEQKFLTADKFQLFQQKNVTKLL